MKKLIYLIVLIVVLGLIVTGCIPVVPPIEQNNTDNLTKGGKINVPADYTSIDAAINAANPGDTIFVAAGTYTENVTVDKSVTIKGASADNTIVQGAGNNTVFHILADKVSVSGFTIKNAYNIWQSGIQISGADNVKIVKNVIEHNAAGVTIWLSNGTSIVNNVVRYSDALEAGNWWEWPRVDNGNGIIVWDDGSGADLNTNIKSNDIYYNFKYGIFVGGATEMNADGTEINGNKLYKNGTYSINANWLGMGFMNAMGTISVGGNNIFPTASGLEYWVSNSPELELDGTPSYGGIPVPPTL